MEKGLFEKYSQKIGEQKLKKEEIISCIRDSVEIKLNENEIQVENNTITFMTSSVKKAALHNKKIRDVLIEKGYSVTL